MSLRERERHTHSHTQHNIIHEQWNLPNMETKLLRCFSWNFRSYSTSSLGKPMYCGRVQRTDLCIPCLYILSKTNQSFVYHTHKSTHTNASEHTPPPLSLKWHHKAEIFTAMVWLETSNITGTSSGSPQSCTFFWRPKRKKVAYAVRPP